MEKENRGFNYELSGIGWADGFIEVNSSLEYFTASYLTDALHDMLKAIISLLPELVPYPVKNSQFEMCEEPGGTVWTLSKIDTAHLNIDIVSFEDLTGRKQLDNRFNETCKIFDFVKAIVLSLDLLLKQHGMDGYRERWINYDFPIKEYSMLKGYLQEKNL